VDRLSRSAIAVALALTLLAPSKALASEDRSGFAHTGFNLLHGRWAAISPMFGLGASQLGHAPAGFNPRVVGVRYSERKGSVTGVVFAILNTVATALAASSPKSVETYRSGDWIVRRTTYRSAAEQEEIRARGRAASEAMLEAEDQSFELELYATSLPGGGEVSGYKLNLFFGIPMGDYFMLDVGLGVGSATARMRRDERQSAIDFSYFGMPLRLNAAAGPVLLWFQWDWNWLGSWTGHTPDAVDEPDRFRRHVTRSHLELGVTTALFERLQLQASMTTHAIDSGKFGFRASVGFRF